MRQVRAWLSDWWTRRLPAQPDIRLTQKHIFIVPTLAGYAFVGALLLMLLVAINYQNSLAYALTFILASVGLLGMLHTWRNLAGLQLTGLPAEPCFAGDAACFALRLHAGGRERQAIALTWPGHAPVLVDVPEGSVQQALLCRTAEFRGRLAAGRIRVETRFPLGIWVAWSQVDLAQSVLVYPRPVQSSQERAIFARGTDDVDGGADSAGRGVDDYQGLEAWQRGDSLRRINWKAWSKGQGLWVKHFAEQQGSQVQLDFSAIGGDVEYRLSILCQQVLQLTRREIAFSLLLPGQPMLGPACGSGHQSDCLAALALYGGGMHGR